MHSFVLKFQKVPIVLWEELIDSVHTGLSYHFNHLTIRIFDDEKFVNSNELTTVEPIPGERLEAEYEVTSRTMYCH